jgi:hypothetical protein
MDLLDNSVIFSDGAENMDNIETDNFADKITQTFTETDAKKIFLPNKSFGFDEARFYPGIPVHVCVLEKSDVRWAITKGIHEDIYLLLRKSSDSRTFDIFGLLEPKPTISSQTELKQLEKKYTNAVKNQRGESVELVASKFFRFSSYPSVIVKWDFLKTIMVRIKFHMWWINMVKGCVSFVDFSILINGQPGKRFKPSCGL